MEESEIKAAVGGEDTGYRLEFRQDGVFLTVYPSEEKSFELIDIRKILHEYEVYDYNIVDLSHAVKEADGEPIKLSGSFTLPSGEKVSTEIGDMTSPEAAPSAGKEETYVNIIVDVSRDRMKATVRYDTKNGTKLPTVDMVLDALNEKRVTYGIDVNAIEEGIKSMNPFVAAEGVPPVHGENAKIERKFDLGLKNKPAVNQYDRVDYKNMNLFILAKKNDILAVRIPQTNGTAGKNVFGDNVPARNGRPIPMPEGKNTKVVGENDLISLIDGQIVDTGRVISVDPHLVLNNGVNVGTGNIDFVGSVEIKGNVDANFIVKATGNIEISGTVSGAVVEGRNVFISGGVRGMNRCKIKAEEDVRVNFVETADIQAGRDIYVNDVILHSNVRAGKKVIVEGKRGQITGGIVAAGIEIKAVVVGNPASVVTRLSVGVNPNLEKEYKEVCARYKEEKKRLQQVTQMLNTLSKIDISKLPEQRISQINALTKSQFPLAGQVARDEKLIAKLNAELMEMENGKISISDVLYAGTRVSVNSIIKNFNSEARRCTLTAKDENVVIGAY